MTTRFLDTTVRLVKRGNENLGEPDDELTAPITLDLTRVEAIHPYVNDDGEAVEGETHYTTAGGDGGVVLLPYDEFRSRWIDCYRTFIG